ncbi:EamA family transporter [Alistipes sp. An31A]|uniref:DMT family transporter n=1 Tax=unclassified Alistipes TaxID=2608932 RepID=UPI000B3679B9|nr:MULTISPECIES: DMT family transporter [unclassified Alistipes]OUO21542.1 EamA family transporter [Alistipes sp. An31A]
MWLTLAFTSAALLGLYDVAKKRALTDNAVLPVLLLNTLFSSLLFVPVIVAAECGLGWFDGTLLESVPGDAHAHALVALKSAIVLVSWVFGYFAMKHLPLTIVGPINATRPVMVLVGAMLLFGERLNGYQWVGVALALLSLFLLSRSGRREGVDFAHNVWILCIAAAAVMGAVSGLYDKYIMARLDPVFVQSWYNFYQLLMMGTVVGLLWWPRRRTTTPFHWSWAIPLISIFLSLADFAYLTALGEEGAMISVVSMVRRGSVVVSFCCGALLFHERNLRAKALDLLFILVGMFFLWLGSR